MIKASYEDKKLVEEILTKSFDTNKSVNFIVQQDSKRIKRIRALMEYSFELCYLYGDVFLSDNKKACALVLFPDKKKTSVKAIILDVKLILQAVGLQNIIKALNRESQIKKRQPAGLMYYLWFIGVDPDYQCSGLGTTLLNDVIADSGQKNRPIYLETSTVKNLPWYQKFGFDVYNELDLGYKLFFLKREVAQ